MWVLKSLCLQKYILAILEVMKEAMIHYSSVKYMSSTGTNNETLLLDVVSL